MLRLMREEWRSGAELSRMLGLAQATVSHHLSKLKSASILDEDRWGKGVYYRLNRSVFASVGEEALRWVVEGERQPGTDSLFTEEGKLRDWPKTRAQQYSVLVKAMESLKRDAFYPTDEMEATMAALYEEDPWTLIREGMEHWMLVRVVGGTWFSRRNVGESEREFRGKMQYTEAIVSKERADERAW